MADRNLDLSMDDLGRMSDVEAGLFEKAAEDRAFYDRLVSDPKAALAEVGISVPADVSVTVLQENASNYYLVIPAALEAAMGAPVELSDRELEAVAGGVNTQNTAWTGCASGAPGCVASSGCEEALSAMSSAGGGR